MDYLKENSVTKRRSEKMSEEELIGKIIVGEFANKPHKELCDNEEDLVSENYDGGLAIKSAFWEEF